MKVSLVQAPCFDQRAPANALALQTALLKRAGIGCAIHDASKCVHKQLPGTSRDASAFRDALASDPARAARLLDAEADHILAQEPDVVGFSVLAWTEGPTLTLAERIKAKSPRTRVVLGGAQCLRENKAFAFARHPAVDAVALSEADLSFPSFLKSWDGRGPLPVAPGMLVKNSRGLEDGGDAPPVEDLDSLPFLDFSGFDARDYSGRFLCLSTTRGCVRKCSFCTHIVGQKTFRTMSAARTVAEIRHQLALHPDLCGVVFSDSLINGNVRRLGQIADQLIQYRIERVATAKKTRTDFGWLGMAILHPTLTPELLRKLRHSGCVELQYGFESGSQKVLDSMQKGYRIADAERIISDTRRAGINPHLFALVGFPTETEDDFRATMDFLERNAGVIGSVGISPCDIQEGSHLDVHPELYGIETPLEDRERWRTKDGSCTYESRRERLARMRAHLAKLGIPDYTAVQGVDEDLGRGALKAIP